MARTSASAKGKRRGTNYGEEPMTATLPLEKRFDKNGRELPGGGLWAEPDPFYWEGLAHVTNAIKLAKTPIERERKKLGGYKVGPPRATIYQSSQELAEKCIVGIYMEALPKKPEPPIDPSPLPNADPEQAEPPQHPGEQYALF